VRADNGIEDDGAASLAPSLGWMTQLTELDLGSTLCAIGGSWGCGERRRCVDGVCCGWGGGVLGCSGWWGLRGASRVAAVRADNGIEDDGAASLAPSLVRMAQLTRLNLGGTLRASAAAGAVSGCLQNAGCGWMMLRGVGRGRCARGCSVWWGLRGASRGAAVRAGNYIEAAGAVSLAPSLGRMAQLTELDLGSTLRAIGGSWRCERVLAERRMCMDGV
jgi:hypothetical protein